MSVIQKTGQVLLATTLIAWLCLSGVASAQQSSSPHYQVNEVQFGSGGNVGSSTHYSGQSSLGSLGGGQSSSADYSSSSGFLTQNEPFLAIGVLSGQVNLGNLVTTATGYGSGSFYVQSYTASGYTVQILGSPPKDATGDVLTAKTTLGTPIVGTEEFGLNVVANPNFCGTSCTLGADPAPIPDNTFAFGQAASGYDTPGEFQYNPGDVIATAPDGNGQTDYTVSYIADINGATPAGVYTMNQDLVVVASY